MAEPEPDFIGYKPGPQTVRDSVAEQYHEEHRQLQTIATELRAIQLECTALLIQGQTIETILAEATKLAATMIILGSHRHNRIQQLIFGSTSEVVAQRANVPVLIVPTH